MADGQVRVQPLTCHGHSRPVPHINFSSINERGGYDLISACKDNNPQLRDGPTGDWIGTFIGHKGAVWQARFSPDGKTAATASADFTAKIWDSHEGSCLFTLQHDHIVRAVAYMPKSNSLVATGGYEKKLRIFDLPEKIESEMVTIEAKSAVEIAPNTHTTAIKFIVWTIDPTTLVTASGDTLRWFDITTQAAIKTLKLDGEIGSCEFNAGFGGKTKDGDDIPLLAVAAGKTVYFWTGVKAMDSVKTIKLDYNVASVAADVKGAKYVVGEDKPATWARVYNWDDDSEIDIHKGHHGPVWSIAFSPDGNLYATGSEDGTIKLWKNCEGKYGLWHGEGAASAE